MKMDWYRHNYPTGKLYMYNRKQGILPVWTEHPFHSGRPYLFVRWSTPVNPITQERMDFDNAVFFVNGSETFIDRGMMRDFELIE